MCLIVGGGAAGYFAAIEMAARVGSRAHVLLLEATSRPLHKVRISGGGRCNVTQACFEVPQLLKGYPRGGPDGTLLGPLRTFQPRDTQAWFAKRGVRLVAEDDGRMFSESNTSETVVACLQTSAANTGVEVLLQHRVTSITASSSNSSSGFSVIGKDETTGIEHTWHPSVVLLATGGARPAYRLASALGHPMVRPVPSLFSFALQDPAAHLAGISVPQAQVTIDLGDSSFTETGSLLFTHWGLSGPAIIRLSAWAARPLHALKYTAPLHINWVPHLDATVAQLQGILNHMRTVAPKKFVRNAPPPVLSTVLSKRLWQHLVERAGIIANQRWNFVTRLQVESLATVLCKDERRLCGRGQFKEEFVTSGGVCVNHVDMQTLQSRLVPDLYFAGELLNIDGITGGYNFQNCWTTGWLAAKAMASQLVRS